MQFRADKMTPSTSPNARLWAMAIVEILNAGHS